MQGCCVMACHTKESNIGTLDCQDRVGVYRLCLIGHGPGCLVNFVLCLSIVLPWHERRPVHCSARTNENTMGAQVHQ